MMIQNNTAVKVAESLLEIQAIKFNLQEPYTWASGLQSPIYCDSRVILAHPPIRTYVRQELSSLVTAKFGNVEAVVGVATGGIPLGALLAQELGKPFAYVRSEAKKHGTKKLIEGGLPKSLRVVVIEDLVSTGKSSLAAVTTLEQAEYKVAGVVAVFNYGFNISAENFKANKCQFYSLTNYEALRKAAEKTSSLNPATSYLKPTELVQLDKWHTEAKTWKPKPKEKADPVQS